MEDKEVIGAVFAENITALLDKLGQLQRVNSGEAVCTICGRVLSVDSIGLIYRDDAGALQYHCTDQACYRSESPTVDEYGRE
jgi:hypothetical protein